jgi:hypothetical protein
MAFAMWSGAQHKTCQNVESKSEAHCDRDERLSLIMLYIVRIRQEKDDP